MDGLVAYPQKKKFPRTEIPGNNFFYYV